MVPSPDASFLTCLRCFLTKLYEQWIPKLCHVGLGRFFTCHIIGNSILIGAKHEFTRAQILVYSQSITITNQTADQQKFDTFILRELSMNQWHRALSGSITFRDLQVNRFCSTNVPFQHERTGMTKLHQCPCSPFQGMPRLHNTRRLYVGAT
jgi:hypothetical protein